MQLFLFTSHPEFIYVMMKLYRFIFDLFPTICYHFSSCPTQNIYSKQYTLLYSVCSCGTSWALWWWCSATIRWESFKFDCCHPVRSRQRGSPTSSRLSTGTRPSWAHPSPEVGYVPECCLLTFYFPTASVRTKWSGPVWTSAAGSTNLKLS